MNQIAQKSVVVKKTDDTCYHCGEACPESPIILEQKSFCCEGCKMVYSILEENDLCRFYDLNETAGLSQKNKPVAQYAFLDDEETVHKLIDFKDEEKTRIRLYLPQIHCSSCLWLLENLFKLEPGIQQSRVDFLKKEVNIVFNDAETSLRKVVELLSRIGYPPLINLNDLDEESKKPVDRSLYYKLGLAGFAFGNIMLLSFPEYLGMDPASNSAFMKFFGYINILLILPVIFYSGRSYLQSAWNGLKQKHLNIDVPISLGILALFGRSIFEILTHTGAGYLDSLAGLIFFLLIGKWFQNKTYAQLSFDRDYKSYFPIACTKKVDGKEESVTLDKIKKGDVLMIRHGDLIPADAILIDGEAEVDYSFVTGESAFIKKEKGAQLYAGGRQMGGLIHISVMKKVSNSYLTSLWNEDTFSKSINQGEVSQLADKVAAVFTWIILTTAGLTLAYWLPKDVGVAINAFTAVLIIACPCAVALSIPFTFGNVIRLLALNDIYFKNTTVIESMARINHVVFDKTGTITVANEGQMEYEGKEMNREERNWVYSLASHSNHPISRRLKEILKDSDLLEVENFNEIKGMGISGTVDGHLIKLGSEEFIHGRQTATNQQSLSISIDDNIIGAFLFKGQYRKGLQAVINQIKSWANLSLLSGDNSREKARLSVFFDQNESLHFNKKPAEKLQFIKTIQNNNHVAMIGDGLNDAGALSQSDVGVVITEHSSNFTPACDVIMDASRFEKLPVLFSISKASIRIVYMAYGIALIYNIIGLSFAVQGTLSPVVAAILMPLSSITIVLFGVGMSSLLAYKYGILKGDTKEENTALRADNLAKAAS